MWAFKSWNSFKRSLYIFHSFLKAIVWKSRIYKQKKGAKAKTHTVVTSSKIFFLLKQGKYDKERKKKVDEKLKASTSTKRGKAGTDKLLMSFLVNGKELVLK